jgi:hypothetical protein
MQDGQTVLDTHANLPAISYSTAGAGRAGYPTGSGTFVAFQPKAGAMSRAIVSSIVAL